MALELDFGDVIASIELRVPGLRRYNMHRHYGVARKSTAAERAVPAAPMRPTPERPKIGVHMDLKADQSVDVNLEWTDERDNPVPAPAGATATYTVDRTDLVTVSADDGAGNATLTANGPLGEAVVNVEVSVDGRTVTGTDIVTVVAGDAERVAIRFGEPRETTPDDGPAPE